MNSCDGAGGPLLSRPSDVAQTRRLRSAGKAPTLSHIHPEDAVEIRQMRQGDLVVLKPIGRLDAVTAETFQAMLLAAVTAAPADVVVDFADVEYISSAGLRALMEAAKLKSRGSRVAVAALNASVRETFAISRFVHVLPIFEQVADAAGSNWTY